MYLQEDAHPVGHDTLVLVALWPGPAGFPLDGKNIRSTAHLSCLVFDHPSLGRLATPPGNILRSAPSACRARLQSSWHPCQKPENVAFEPCGPAARQDDTPAAPRQTNAGAGDCTGRLKTGRAWHVALTSSLLCHHG